MPDGTSVKNLPANAGDPGDVDLIPGWERFPGEGNGNPLQYSCLESPMDRGSWWATVHGAAKSWTRLNNYTLYIYILFFPILPLLPYRAVHLKSVIITS